MAKISGGTRTVSPQSKNTTQKDYSVQSIKSGILSYSKTDKWNKSTDYHMGFNDEAQGYIERLAKGNYGLATTIAKQAVEKPSWDRYGANFSEKQAYVLAKAIYDNNLLDSAKRTPIVFQEHEVAPKKKKKVPFTPISLRNK